MMNVDGAWCLLYTLIIQEGCFTVTHVTNRVRYRLHIGCGIQCEVLYTSEHKNTTTRKSLPKKKKVK